MSVTTATHESALRFPRLAAFLSSTGLPEKALTYHAVQGYLFISVHSLCVTDRDEWLRGVFGGDEAGYRQILARPALLADLADLEHEIQERGPSLPDDCRLLTNSLENLRDGAPIREWALGFARGYGLFNDWWTRPLPRLHTAQHEFALIRLLAFADQDAALRNAREFLGEEVSLEWIAGYSNKTFGSAMQYFVDGLESDIFECRMSLDESDVYRCMKAFVDGPARSSTDLLPASIIGTSVDHRFLRLYLAHRHRLRDHLRIQGLVGDIGIDALLQDAWLAVYIRLSRGETIPAPILTLVTAAENLVTLAKGGQSSSSCDRTIAFDAPEQSIYALQAATTTTLKSDDMTRAWNNFLRRERMVAKSITRNLPESAFVPYFYRTVLSKPFREIAERCKISEMQAISYVYRGLKLRHELLSSRHPMTPQASQ